MSNMLDRIIEQKRKEVAVLVQNSLVQQILQQERQASTVMQEALQQGFSLIAEIKKRSPSVGAIDLDLDPISQAKKYQANGAAAISILTDQTFFGGSLQDIERVRSEFKTIPILRKDFVIDPLQMAETVLSQASAVLLIVAVLGSATQKMLKEAKRLGLEAIVEIHNVAELKIALESGATMIGVNSRDLKTFKIDLTIAESLAAHLPKNIVKIAESGIKTAEDARRMQACGYDAILVGEALVKTEHSEIYNLFEKP